MKNDLERLQILVGMEFDEDEIICSMEDEEEPVIVNEIVGYTSNFEEDGICQLYNAYYNLEDAELYNVWVNEENIIVEVA